MAPLRACLLSLMLLGLVTVAGASGGVATADAAACTSPITYADWYNAHPQCIGGVRINARGWLQGDCVGQKPMLPGTYYPDSKWCGKGPEAIAQSRALSYLGSKYEAWRVQWELQLGGTYADITLQQLSGIDVYEVKLSNNPRDPVLQVDGYVSALNNLNVDPEARKGNGTSGALKGYHDLFFVAQKTKCTLANGDRMPEYRAYAVGAFQLDGVLPVLVSPKLSCFDPNEGNPSLEEVTVTVDGQAYPVGDVLDGKPLPPPASYPGTDLPEATPPSGGGSGTPGGSGSPVGGNAGNGNGGFGNGPGGTGGGTGGTGGGTGGPGVTGGGQAGPGNWSGPGGGKGTGTGDPHMTTFDGLSYEFQTVGEFTLAHSSLLGLNVQVRTVSTGPGSNVSVIDRAAMNINSTVVEMSADGALLVDGEVTALTDGGSIDLGDGASVSRSGAVYTATWPGTGHVPTLTMVGTDVELDVPYAFDLRGLLGNGDGDPSNDLVTAADDPLPSSPTASEIYGTFANSWRIDDDDSLFTYGSDESTETYTDLTFPSEVVTINDLDDTQLAEGTAECSQAGVVDGPQFDDCVLDWAQTLDSAFVESAAQRVDAVVEPGARSVDTSGTITEAFEGTVSSNFASPRYGSLTGSGRFAGPFGHGGRYVFYVPSLPSHSAVSVSMNLISFGEVDPLDGTSTSVTVNGQVVWQENLATLMPTATGISPSGDPYTVYPITFTVAHHDGQLNVGVAADAPIGSDRALGVDDLSASLTLEPPQQFGVSLPASVSDGSPASGAGNIEDPSGQDDYSFTTTVAGDVQLDLSDCASSLNGWVYFTLQNTTTNDVLSEGWSCWSHTIKDVPSGSYRLSITNGGHTGTYRLGIGLRPAPESFAVSLPTAVSDGVPSAGAGNLETTSSEDGYTFTTAHKGALELSPSDCDTALSGALDYALTDTATDDLIANGTVHCDSGRRLRGLPAGDYRLAITRNGRHGAYTLGLSSVAPQAFAVSLPLDASNGSPTTGMGNLETRASEDDYTFTTAAEGNVVVDLSSCTGFFWVSYKLVNTDTDTDVDQGWSCWSMTFNDLPAAHYRLEIDYDGSIGTYHVGIDLQPVPQTYAVSLPVTVSDGDPATGAGNLETTSSEDRYTFTTTTKAALELELSGCDSNLNNGVHYELTDTNDHHRVTGARVLCNADTQVRDLPAGDYQVAITDPPYHGAYTLKLSSVAPQAFPVSLPLDASNDTPTTGMGNLETRASEDDYTFTTATAANLVVDLSSCTGFFWVSYKLVNTDTGNSIDEGWSCWSTTYNNLPAANYRLEINYGGFTGTYHLGIGLQPPPQSFALSLPATISNGTPSTGAGNLETSSSEDRYTFTTTTKAALELELSGCDSSLNNGVHYELTDTNDHHRVTGARVLCNADTQVRSLPAGDYQVAITDPPYHGAYTLKLSSVAPQTFAVSLPLNASDGSPTTGMGNLETRASEDDYTFTTTQTADLHVALSSCVGFTWVSYKLINTDTGNNVDEGWSCWSTTYNNLPAASYRLEINYGSFTGTYHLDLT
jgi:uncharacterized protein YdeI (BOF family)